MVCDHCKKNEATKTFIANWMGEQHEVHLCEECLEQMWHYAGMAGQRQMFAAVAGWWPGKEDARELGGHAFPERADASLIARRKIAALHARLDEAAQKENYREAARLRDSLTRLEANREVLSDES